MRVGDRVLVRNVGLQGRQKLANRWTDDVYVVVEQPNPEIPVYVVKREGRSQATRTLHRSLLLPVNFLPLPKELQKYVYQRNPASKTQGEASENPEEK